MPEEIEKLENLFRLGDYSVVPELINLWQQTGTGPFAGDIEPPMLMITIEPGQLGRRASAGRSASSYGMGTLRIDFLSEQKIIFSGLIPAEDRSYAVDFRGEGLYKIPSQFEMRGRPNRQRDSRWQFYNFDIQVSPEGVDLSVLEIQHLETAIYPIIRHNIKMNSEMLAQAKQHRLQASIRDYLNQLARQEMIILALKRQLQRNISDYLEIPQPPTPVIEITYDPEAEIGGLVGGYRARLASNHRIHSVGVSQEVALADLLRTLKSFGESDIEIDYEIRTDYE